MSFIINSNSDSHKIFIRHLNEDNVRTKIFWKKGDEYCIDTLTYIDYSKAKKIQIMLYKNYGDIPIV